MQSPFFDFSQVPGIQQITQTPGINFWSLQQQNTKMMYLTLLLQQQEQQQRQLLFRRQQAQETSFLNLVSSQVPLTRHLLNLENMIAGQVSKPSYDPQNLAALHAELTRRLPLTKKDTIITKLEEPHSLGLSPMIDKTLEMFHLTQKQESNASTAPRYQESFSDTETKVSIKVKCTGKSQDDRSALKVSKTPAKGKSTKKISRKNKIKCRHADRKHYAKGLCNNCYHKFGRKEKPWLCDHNLHYAKGWCQKCYLNQYKQKRIEAKLQMQLQKAEETSTTEVKKDRVEAEVSPSLTRSF